MFIREYECEECGEVQEKWLKSRDEENKEPCEKCGAPASSLIPVLSSSHRHGSWGRWTV